MISAFAFVADVALHTHSHTCLTSRQSSQHAHCDWQDLNDLRITEWQDGKKRFDASACRLPRVVGGGGGGKGSGWGAVFGGSVAFLHTWKRPFVFLSRSSELWSCLAFHIASISKFPVTDVRHLFGQTLALLMAGTEHWKTLKFSRWRWRTGDT